MSKKEFDHTQVWPGGFMPASPPKRPWVDLADERDTDYKSRRGSHLDKVIDQAVVRFIVTTDLQLSKEQTVALQEACEEVWQACGEFAERHLGRKQTAKGRQERSATKKKRLEQVRAIFDEGITDSEEIAEEMLGRHEDSLGSRQVRNYIKEMSP
ncbi:hypothetical protein N8Z04_01450 [bacterium]|nr:hypothetical protein [bacterium]